MSLRNFSETSSRLAGTPTIHHSSRSHSRVLACFGIFIFARRRVDFGTLCRLCRVFFFRSAPQPYSRSAKTTSKTTTTPPHLPSPLTCWRPSEKKYKSEPAQSKTYRLHPLPPPGLLLLPRLDNDCRACSCEWYSSVCFAAPPPCHASLRFVVREGRRSRLLSVFLGEDTPAPLAYTDGHGEKGHRAERREESARGPGSTPAGQRSVSDELRDMRGSASAHSSSSNNICVPVSSTE